MPDLSYMDPPIEIAASSLRFKIIASRVRSGGMRPYAASDIVDFRSSDPLLIDISSASKALIESCCKAVMTGLSRSLVILDVADSGLYLSDTLTVRRDRDLVILKGRLSAMSRREARNLEADIRAETAREFGLSAPRAPSDTQLHVIYCGQSSPLFLSLRGALKARGVLLTAALTPSTARNFLSTRKFSAVLLDLSSANENAAWLEEISLPGEPFNGLPVIALIDGQGRLPEEAQTLLSQADDILEYQDHEADLARRIESLARKYQALSPVASAHAPASTATDKATGLFSRQFLEVHLERQMQVSDTRGEALSVMTLKLAGERRSDMRTLGAFADCIRTILRETDCAAVAATGTIAVSLPLTPYRGGAQLAHRIAALVSEHQDLSGLALDWRVVEKRAFHNAKSLLEAGLTGPFMRLDAA